MHHLLKTACSMGSVTELGKRLQDLPLLGHAEFSAGAMASKAGSGSEPG